MKNPPLLSLRDINVTVDVDKAQLPILRSVTAEFRSGETVAIVGPSGSGKTTLMMLCAGLQPPSSGTIAFNGETLAVHDEEELTAWRRRHVGIVFQHFHLLPTNTALENVMLPLELAGADKPREQATALLEAVGLTHRLDHLPKQLSGGEQQRVALARAIAGKPALLLADEPTGNLDQGTGQKVMELLFGTARDHGTTLVLITHDPHLAQRCDRIITLQDGTIAHA